VKLFLNILVALRACSSYIKGMIQDKHLQTNKEISEDTGRTPKERDLARILGVAEILLAREMFESAQAILRIYLEEFEETVAL
jgi:hypothetical protein